MAEEKAEKPATIADQIVIHQREIERLKLEQNKRDEKVLRKAFQIQQARGTVEAQKAMESAPTASSQVDWSKSKDVALPTVPLQQPAAPPTPQERKTANFLTGFGQAAGKPTPLLVNLGSGKQPR